ncbi:DNA-directed RNA polymerase I subunit [Dictyocoela muelleri]|nr:DNA-directed RNA polymerase I subunit [Dictyocoela muelleri]
MKLNDLAKPHINSFNAFIKNIPILISNLPQTTITIENQKVKIIFEDFEIKRCDKKIDECRESLSNYSGKAFLTVRILVNGKTYYHDKKGVGNFPIMINSILGDKDDIGGYFLINGIEKMVRFIIVQKRNHPLALNRKSFVQKGSLFTEHCVLIRSVGEDETGQTNSLHYCKNGNIILRFFLKRTEYLVPIVLILRVLKDTTDEEIFQKTGRRQMLEQNYPFSKKECVKFLGSKFKEIFEDDEISCVRQILEVVCPHLKRNEDKFEFLCLSIRKLYGLTDGNAQDDVDLLMNQEVFTEFQLFSALFKEKLIHCLAVTKTIKTLDQLKRLDFSIGSKFEYFLSTGNLNLTMFSDIMQESGLCIHAERINLLRFISHFRAINRGSFFQTVKITSVRKLRPESFGFICPVHTPDGAPCGLLTHMTLQASVTNDYVDFDVYQFGILNEYHENSVVVVMNGKVLGYSKSPEELVMTLRNFRNKSGLNFEIAYISDDSLLYPGIFIFSHPGRFYRPIMRKGKIENIGPMEQVFLKICLKTDDLKNQIKNNFYQEISSENLSLVASLIPYKKHNQSPRNMYQCQMAKQGLSIPSFNFLNRTDNKMYVLNNGQKPLVYTETQKMFELDKIPTGVNCVVAVLSYTAYDMEDAMVINKSSLERGMFSAFIYQTIQLDGEITQMVNIGTHLQKNDILCYRNDMPVISDGGIVDTIRVCENKTIVTMRIRRDPIIGDKFCSRHGQKGVCSAQWDQSDMPFTEDGICPDIIINPHAFPSRMTIGMMIESIMGKAGCIKGESIESCENPECGNESKDEKNRKSFSGNFYSDKKKFANPNTKIVNEYLLSQGYDYHGNEVMYSGVTGQKLKVDIFIGVVFYQRLRHMVSDKFQVRATGPIQMQTRQPIGGRKNLGGIRLGEMERDALIGHGCSFILQDRLLNCSDGTLFRYCDSCKTVLFSKKKVCLCGNWKLKEVVLPYVFKYLCSELVAMNIRVKMDIK